jgi:hypothetical protein
MPHPCPLRPSLSFSNCASAVRQVSVPPGCQFARDAISPFVNVGWLAPSVSVAHANMLAMQPDWFAQLTGFRETSYDAARRQLVVEGDELVSKVNGKRYGNGTLEVATLAELCTRVEVPTDGRTAVQCVDGEARAMHADPELEGALFQVASQFNLLEMTGPSVTPEDRVTRYSGGSHTGAGVRNRGGRRDDLPQLLRTRRR